MAYENDKYPRWRQRWDANVSKIDNEINSWWNNPANATRTQGQQFAAGASNATENFKQAADRTGDNIARGADNLGDSFARGADRTGDTIAGWWKGLKANVADWFDNDADDPDTRAEIQRAWNDDEYLTERFNERRTYLGR
jgi:hypothetical protein